MSQQDKHWRATGFGGNTSFTLDCDTLEAAQEVAMEFRQEGCNYVEIFHYVDEQWHFIERVGKAVAA